MYKYILLITMSIFMTIYSTDDKNSYVMESALNSNIPHSEYKESHSRQDIYVNDSIQCILNREVVYFTEDSDLLDFFLLSRRNCRNKTIGLDIRFEKPAGISRLIANDICDSTAVGKYLLNNYKFVDYKTQLGLLNDFLCNLQSVSDSVALRSINYQMDGSNGAISEISNRYFNSPKQDIESLYQIIYTSKMKTGLDSILSYHNLRIRDIQIDEGIYYIVDNQSSSNVSIGSTNDILFFYATFVLDKN